MLMTFALAGGALSTGYLLYTRRFKAQPELNTQTKLETQSSFNTQSKLQTQPNRWLTDFRNQWVKLSFAQQKEYNEVEEDFLEDEFSIEQQLSLSNRGLLSSMVSLGFATIGTFVYTPISFMVIPTLTYLGIPSAQQAAQRLFQEHKVGTSLLELGAIVFCIVQGHYIIGSVGFGAYYLIRILFYKRQQSKQNALTEWQTPNIVRLQTKGVEYEVATSKVQRGDIIIVQTGEMVALDGIIIEGTAWINRRGTDAKENPIIQTIGHNVKATDIVLVGQISIEI